MKKILLLSIIIFFTAFLAHSQRGFGFDVGMSTSKAPMIAIKYFVKKNAGSIGFSYQVFNDAVGEKKDFIPGSFAIGDGWFFYSVDLGYTRILNENFSISGEVSIGQKRHFQNLTDNSSSQDQYHRFLKTKSVVGGGAFLIYNLTDNFGFFAGYNSIREGTFGIQLKFVK